MTEAAEMGFGTLETTQTTNNRTVKHFQKRCWSELSDDATQLLKKLRVTVLITVPLDHLLNLHLIANIYILVTTTLEDTGSG